MSLHSWLQNLRSALVLGRGQRHHRRPGSRWPATRRPHFEVLEDRLTPSFVWDGSYPESPPGVVWGGGGGSSPLLADFTSDGVLDEINIGTELGRFEMVVRPGRVDGTFGDPISSYAPNAGDFAVADFNFDGRLDVFTAASAFWPEDPNSPALGDTLLGRGDGTFEVWSTQSLFGVVSPAAVGAVNGSVVIAGSSVYSMPPNSDTFVYLWNDGIWPNTPQLGIGDASVTEGNTGVVEAVFTVTLANGPDQPVTVRYDTADGGATAGSDYQAASGTLTFAPGETSKTITVLVNGDHLVEPTEGFAVILSNSTNANIVDAYGQCTIRDDESRISITDAAIAEGHTGTRSATFTVTLSSISEVDVTVHYETADIWGAVAGSDYTAASGDVVIPAGQSGATFTIAVMGDRLAEANESFAVDLSAPTNAAIVDGRGIGTILDDEPRVSIGDATKREGRNGKTTLLTFTVKLSAAYDQPVTMSFRTVDGTATTADSDYIAKSGSLTFAPGETTKTITIEVKGDSKQEASETFSLDLFDLSSNALFTKNRGVGTILNDD